MATKKLSPEDARALKTLEAIYGSPEDVDDDSPFDPAAIARMRAAVDRAFDRVRRPGLLALTREALRARIAQIKLALGPELQLAHRSLAEMSDDDLRSLLADLEEYAEHKGLAV